jgi:hypothetical protein
MLHEGGSDDDEDESMEDDDDDEDGSGHSSSDSNKSSCSSDCDRWNKKEIDQTNEDKKDDDSDDADNEILGDEFLKKVQNLGPTVRLDYTELEAYMKKKRLEGLDIE